ncbi:hypothetical protein F5X98DRAFT_166306 [Xylaria grammica]|nr:hypothetical protein F5X98DRAFT_166306 [Xylaria grammica]
MYHHYREIDGTPFWIDQCKHTEAPHREGKAGTRSIPSDQSIETGLFWPRRAQKKRSEVRKSQGKSGLPSPPLPIYSYVHRSGTEAGNEMRARPVARATCLKVLLSVWNKNPRAAADSFPVKAPVRRRSAGLPVRFSLAAHTANPWSGLFFPLIAPPPPPNGTEVLFSASSLETDTGFLVPELHFWRLRAWSGRINKLGFPPARWRCETCQLPLVGPFALHTMWRCS